MKTLISSITPWLSLGLLAFVAFISVKSYLIKPPVLYNREKITEIKNDSVQHWKDEAGREHAQRQLAESNLATIEAFYGPLIDSVKKSLRLQGNKLDNITALSNYTAGTVHLRVDTVYTRDHSYPHFTYNDRWIDLDGVLADTPIIKYSTFDSLIVTTYHKRKWLLGKKNTYVDAYSLNPSSHISGLTGLKVATEKPKRWGVGPYIGYGFNGQQWQPSLGISLQYSLIKF